MARRLVGVLALVAAVGLLSACSGADARRATQLMSQAQLAQSKLVSATYDVRAVISGGNQNFTLLMNGGGYLKGPHAGDQFLAVQGEGLPIPLQFQLIARNGQAVVQANGQSQSFPMPRGSATSNSSNWTAMVGNLARYVKRVDVRDTVVGGVPGTTVAGDIDTAGLVKAAAGLSAFSKFSGAPSVGDASKHLGETHVVLFISARTHLIRSASIDLTVKGEGKSIKMQFLYALRSVNQPVAFPQS